MSEKLLRRLFEGFSLIPIGRWARYPSIMGCGPPWRPGGSRGSWRHPTLHLFGLAKPPLFRLSRPFPSVRLSLQIEQIARQGDPFIRFRNEKFIQWVDYASCRRPKTSNIS